MCKYLCGREIGLNQELINSGLLNSFKIMELICQLEEEYNINFSADEIAEVENFSCVNNIVMIMNNKIN